MHELISVGIFLAALVVGLLAFAPRVSESLVRSSARRLPYRLAARMREEWLAELDALPGRPSQLAFAIALTLTRRHSFAIEEESLFAAPARSPVTVATFGGWPAVVVFTTAVAAALVYAASFLIPPLYQSHTLVLVVPPRVPARFVEPAVRITIDERVREISQLVLSRQRLEDIILQLDLYRSDRGLPTSTRDTVTNGRDLTAPNGPRIGDAAIERMRQDISVDVHADSQSFELAYVSPDPQVAWKVADRLTALFIETDLRDKEEIGDSAGKFLDAQIEDVRSRLLKPTGLTSPSPAEPFRSGCAGSGTREPESDVSRAVAQEGTREHLDKPRNAADRRAVQAAGPGAPAGSAYQSRSHPSDAPGRGRRVLPRRRDDAGWTLWTGHTAGEDVGTVMNNEFHQSDPRPPATRRMGWIAWILIPAILGAVIGAGVAARTKPLYRSDARILVVPQRVPESYVRSSGTTNLRERVQSISQQILSRTRLERVIQDFDLYQEERRTGVMEDIVDRMRKNIEVNVEDGGTLAVGFIGTDPRTVMKVTDRLSIALHRRELARQRSAGGGHQSVSGGSNGTRSQATRGNEQAGARSEREGTARGGNVGD